MRRINAEARNFVWFEVEDAATGALSYFNTDTNSFQWERPSNVKIGKVKESPEATRAAALEHQRVLMATMKLQRKFRVKINKQILERLALDVNNFFYRQKRSFEMVLHSESEEVNALFENLKKVKTANLSRRLFMDSVSKGDLDFIQGCQMTLKIDPKCAPALKTVGQILFKYGNAQLAAVFLQKSLLADARKRNKAQGFYARLLVSLFHTVQTSPMLDGFLLQLVVQAVQAYMKLDPRFLDSSSNASIFADLAVSIGEFGVAEGTLLECLERLKDNKGTPKLDRAHINLRLLTCSSSTKDYEKCLKYCNALQVEGGDFENDTASLFTRTDLNLLKAHYHDLLGQSKKSHSLYVEAHALCHTSNSDISDPVSNSDLRRYRLCYCP
jgi:hypothetical protein